MTLAENQQQTVKLNQPVPVYIPTPKHILEARKVNGTTTVNDECSVRKKPKLEYVPKAITNHNEPIPTYIPSALSSTSNVDAMHSEYEPTHPSTVNNQNVYMNTIDLDQNGDDITGLLTELSNEQTSHDEKIIGKPNVENFSKTLNEDNERSSKENSHRTSSSSSSRHRHHSSSYKSSHSSSRSSSSSHRSSHNSSRKKKHSDKDKHRDKDKDSNESRRHRNKLSSTHRHKSSEHSDKKLRSNNNSSSKKEEDEGDDCDTNSMIYDADSGDDIEQQCRMIFEQFDPSTIEKQSNEMPDELLQVKDVTDSVTDETAKKKRVAHENADKLIKPIVPIKNTANHMRNAMQVCIMCSQLMSE